LFQHQSVPAQPAAVATTVPDPTSRRMTSWMHRSVSIGNYLRRRGEWNRGCRRWKEWASNLLPHGGSLSPPATIGSEVCVVHQQASECAIACILRVIPAVSCRRGELYRRLHNRTMKRRAFFAHRFQVRVYHRLARIPLDTMSLPL
jgi:hypothetical protein